MSIFQGDQQSLSILTLNFYLEKEWALLLSLAKKLVVEHENKRFCQDDILR